MKKEDRLELLEGIDTSTMTKKEIGKIIGEGMTRDSVRKFILVNKIPNRNPNPAHIHPVLITEAKVVHAINKIMAQNRKLTYETLGSELGFSKQRALSVVQKYSLVERFKLAKAK